MADKVDFITLLDTLETGYEDDTHLLREAIDIALKRTARAAQRSGAEAKMALLISVKPQKNGEMHVGGKIKTTLPAPGAFPVRMYVDRSGVLVSEDPEQQRLPNMSVVGKDDVQ